MKNILLLMFTLTTLVSCKQEPEVSKVESIEIPKIDNTSSIFFLSIPRGSKTE